MFGRALTPAAGEPAAWITEDVTPVPRNIYGVTKTAAENLCELIHRDHGLPVVILRLAGLRDVRPIGPFGSSETMAFGGDQAGRRRAC